MSENELSGKVGLDTTDFKSGIATLNREIRVVESGFRAAAAGLGDWAKDASGLEMRIKALNEKIGLQTSKVEALQVEYQRVAAEKGATSVAAQNLQIRLNRETETLGKMKSELGKTTESLDKMRSETDSAGEEVQDLAQEEKKAEKATKDMGEAEEKAAKDTKKLDNALEGAKKAAKAAAIAVGAVATAVAGIAVGLGKLAVDAAGLESIGDAFETTAARVGLSSQELLSSMSNAAAGTISDFELMRQANFALAGAGDEFGQQFGVALPTLLEIARASARATGEDVGYLYDSLVTGIKRASPMILDNLGIQIKLDDANQAYAESLGKTVDELTTEERQVALLNAVMEASEGILEGVDLETKTNAESMQSLKAEAQNLADTIGVALQPALSGLLSGGEGYLSRISNLVSNTLDDGNFGALAAGFGNIFGDIIGSIAENAPDIVEGVLGIIQTFASAIITNLPVIMPAVIQIITSIVQFLIQLAPMLIQGAITIITTLAQGLVQLLPTILEAGISILISLLQGITQALPMLIQMITGLIPELVLLLIENLPLMIDAAIEMILALVQGLVQALPTLIAYIPDIITAIFDALITALPTIISAAVEIILALIEGLVTAIPQLVEYIPEIITAIIDTIITLLPLIGEAAVQIIIALIEGVATMLPSLGEAAVDIITSLVEGIGRLATQILNVGRDIVTGIWNGIQARASWFGDQIRSFFSGIIDSVKDALGIASPSRIFAGIGTNMALGLGQGFSDSFRDIENRITGAVGNMTAGVNLAAAAGAGTVTNHVPVYATVNGTMDAHALAVILRNELRRM